MSRREIHQCDRCGHEFGGREASFELAGSAMPRSAPGSTYELCSPCKTALEKFLAQDDDEDP